MDFQPTRLALVAAIALSAAACTETTAPTPTYEFAGTYKTATKFGGAAGTWNAGADLIITSDKVVIYGGVTIVNPTVTETEVAWSRADGNTHNADFTLLTSSSSSYFWENTPVMGKLFQGRRQSAGEGYLDFRGLAQ